MRLLARYSFGVRVFTKHKDNENGYQNPGEPKRHQGAGKRGEGGHAVWRSAHPSQAAAAWQSPSSGEQQAGPRALQPHTLPFHINSSHPRP